MTEQPMHYSRHDLAVLIQHAVVLAESKESLLSRDDLLAIAAELGIPRDAMHAAIASLPRTERRRSNFQEILPVLAFPASTAWTVAAMTSVAGDPVLPALVTGFTVLLSAFRARGSHVHFRFQIGNAAAWLGLVFGVQFSDAYLAADAMGVAELFGIALAIAGPVVITVKRRLHDRASHGDGPRPTQRQGQNMLARVSSWFRGSGWASTGRAFFERHHWHTSGSGAARPEWDH